MRFVVGGVFCDYEGQVVCDVPWVVSHVHYQNLFRAFTSLYKTLILEWLHVFMIRFVIFHFEEQSFTRNCGVGQGRFAWTDVMDKQGSVLCVVSRLRCLEARSIDDFSKIVEIPIERCVY